MRSGSPIPDEPSQHTASKTVRDPSDIDDSWYGVFQGGGARGIAYAGALTAFHDSRRWFRATAGASAGALTAALISAGHQPSSLTDTVGALLTSIKGRVPLLDELLGRIHPALAQWRLDDFWSQVDHALRDGSPRLAAAVQDKPAVTFGDLHLHVEHPIDLYVVTYDLAGNEPVVLSHHNHKDVPVASAVLASCAIPLVFPYALGTRRDAPDETARLVDGGVFANLPEFVFSDGTVRGYLNLPPVDNDMRMVSFTLGLPAGTTHVAEVVTEGSPGWTVKATVKRRRADRRTWTVQQCAQRKIQDPAAMISALGPKDPVHFRTSDDITKYERKVASRAFRYGMKLGLLYYLKQSLLVAGTLLAVVILMFGAADISQRFLGSTASRWLTVAFGVLLAAALRFLWLARTTAIPVVSSILRVHTGVPSSIGHASRMVIFVVGERLSKMRSTRFKVPASTVSLVTTEGYKVAKRQIDYYNVCESNVFADLRAAEFGTLSVATLLERVGQVAKASGDLKETESFEAWASHILEQRKLASHPGGEREDSGELSK